MIDENKKRIFILIGNLHLVAYELKDLHMEFPNDKRLKKKLESIENNINDYLDYLEDKFEIEQKSKDYFKTEKQKQYRKQYRTYKEYKE